MERSCMILQDLSKFLQDLMQDLAGSCKILPRSWNVRSCHDHDKILQDPARSYVRSCKNLERSCKIMQDLSMILQDLCKILVQILQDLAMIMARSCKILGKILQELGNILQDHARSFHDLAGFM